MVNACIERDANGTHRVILQACQIQTLARIRKTPGNRRGV